MTIATIVTRGYGSFGDIAHVVTSGYDIRSGRIVVIDTHDDGPERRKRYASEIERKQEQRLQLETLFGMHPVAELPVAVREAVKPYVPRKQRAQPVAQVAKWELMLADESVMRRLVDEYEAHLAAQEDDDFIVTMLLH